MNYLFPLSKLQYNFLCMNITSVQNPRVKHIVKLRDDKRQRKGDGLMLVEGYDEIQLALSAGYKPELILSAPELISRQMSEVNAENITVNRVVFEKMSYRENPDGWLGWRIGARSVGSRD